MEQNTKRTRAKSVDFSTLVYGKIPPQAKELEEYIIGAMIMDDMFKVITDVREILKPEDFYVNAHQIIAKAIYALSEEGAVDIRLLAERLKKEEKLDEVGGVFAIMQFTNKVNNVTNIKNYCLIVKQKSVQRNLISFAGTILEKSYLESEDVFETLHEAENKLKGINNELAELKNVPLVDIASSIIEKFDTKVYKAKNNIVDENLIYTGFEEWDNVNGGLFPGVYVVAGRPGMGKGVHLTELACRMGIHHDIGIINGEMTDEQLLRRIGCNLMSIDNFLFKKNPQYVTEEEQDLLKEAMNEALKLRLHIENNKYIHKIENKIKYWIEKFNIKCVLADFLTLFKVPPELDRYYTDKQKVDYCLERFVSLAKDFNIPIILYVQMNREILGRSGTKEPNLADLKNSGSIEELAFQVSFLHRPEYYDTDSVTDEMGESTKGLMYQIIAKHRDGVLHRIKHRAILQCSQLKSWGEPAFQKLTDFPF